VAQAAGLFVAILGRYALSAAGRFISLTGIEEEAGNEARKNRGFATGCVDGVKRLCLPVWLCGAVWRRASGPLRHLLRICLTGPPGCVLLCGHE